jgi:hypothetical protein
MDPSKVDNLPPVAYLNADFLKSPEARLLRILSEYIEPAQRLRRHRVRDTIVFSARRARSRPMPPNNVCEWSNRR